MACILENIYVMRCKEIGCAVAVGLNNGTLRERDQIVEERERHRVIISAV